MRTLAIVCCALLLAGCVSISNPFVRMKPDYAAVPEEALRTAARAMEVAVQEGRRDATIADQDGLVVNTPEIMQAMRTRAARYELLAAFMNTGHAWEQRSGLVSILRTKDYKKATTRQQRDRHALSVMSENTDRWIIYEGLLEANNLPPRALSAVQAIFFEARRDVLRTGWKYEDEHGNPATK